MGTTFQELKKRFKGRSVRPESEVRNVESYLFKQVRRAGYRAVKYEDPSVDGGPDRLILGPGAFIEFVETKTAVGKLSPVQKAYHRELRRQGYRVLVLRSKEEVDAYVAYLRSLRSLEGL